MGAPAFRFFKDGVLRLWNFADLLRRDEDYNVIDSEDAVFVPRVPYGTTDQNLAERIWMKFIAADDVVEVYYDETLMFKFDAVNGNLIFGFNDISVLPLTKGGTGYEAVGADPAAQLVDLLTNYFGLKGAAYKNAGTGADQVLLLAEANKLPALDGSLLTGISNIPPGQIAFFAQNFAPTGWLKANGAAVSRVTYAALFSNISTQWGEGNGTTTFTLPDLRGEFPRFWDDGRGIDSGRAFGSFQADELKSHRHTYYSGTGESTTHSARPANAQNYANYQALLTEYSGGSETRPRNVSLLGCIKY